MEAQEIVGRHISMNYCNLEVQKNYNFSVREVVGNFNL
jgi:hypothetical protein